MGSIFLDSESRSASQLSLGKITSCGFRGKTWEVLSTNGVMPDLPPKCVKPGVPRVFFAPCLWVRAARLRSHWIPTKVDLHVHEITCRSKGKARWCGIKAMLLRYSPRNFLEISRAKSCSLFFHSIEAGFPDLNTATKFCDVFP